MLIDLLYFYLLILGFMLLFFLLSLLIKDNSIVDIAWGLGVVVTAIVSLIHYSDIHLKKIVMTTMAVCWGSRLALYIVIRKRGQGEDYRYKAFRDRWGKYFVLKSLIYIYLFQGTLQLVMVSPVLAVNRSAQTGWRFFDFFGMALFLIGFFTETIADWQMYRFKKNPANSGKLMTTGIWRYSRHPNYFGEIVLWWGFGFMALSIRGGWMTLLSPLLVTYLLLFLSGIPMLEKKYQERTDFQSYRARTSALIPWFQKKSS